MKNSLFIFCFFTLNLMAQNATKLDFNKPYNDQIISKAKEGKYPVNLEKGNLYDVAVFQNGIDVLVEILDKDNKKLAEKDSPNGSWGFEKFKFTPTQTALYFINIKRLDEKGNPD
jgi:hypothetical protein